MSKSHVDAASDSFKDGVFHAVRVEVLSFRQTDGMVMLDEKADDKGVVNAAHNNPLSSWRNRVMEFPYPALAARRGLAIVAT